MEVPDEGPGEHCVFQTYVVKAERRDALKRYLNENGVEALIHYATPIHLQPAAKSLGYSAADFPKTMRHVARIMSLPLYPTLTHAQQDRVVELVSAFYKKLTTGHSTMQVKYSYLDQQFAEVDAHFQDLRKLVSTGEFTLGPFVEAF